MDFSPDLRRHFITSMVKSGIRIVGYLTLLLVPVPHMWIASAVLVLSELVGIVEELV